MLLLPNARVFQRKSAPNCGPSSKNIYECSRRWNGCIRFDRNAFWFGRAYLRGSASYFALGASLFAPVRIVGVIGQDFPQDYIDLFNRRNIDIEGIQREKGDTFHWRGRYHEDINLRDTLELHLNVLAGFKPRLPQRYRDAEYVFLGNIDPA